MSAWPTRVAAYRPYATSMPGTSWTLRASRPAPTIATASTIVPPTFQPAGVRRRSAGAPPPRRLEHQQRRQRRQRRSAPAARAALPIHGDQRRSSRRARRRSRRPCWRRRRRRPAAPDPGRARRPTPAPAESSRPTGSRRQHRPERSARDRAGSVNHGRRSRCDGLIGQYGSDSRQHVRRPGDRGAQQQLAPAERDAAATLDAARRSPSRALLPMPRPTRNTARISEKV